MPGFVEWSAAKNVDQNAAEAESKGDEVHEPDTAFVLSVAHDFGVEEKEGMFDGPVAGKIEGVGGDGEFVAIHCVGRVLVLPVETQS